MQGRSFFFFFFSTFQSEDLVDGNLSKTFAFREIFWTVEIGRKGRKEDDVLSKCLWKAEMEDLDVGKSGSGSFTLFFLLVYNSFIIRRKQRFQENCSPEVEIYQAEKKPTICYSNKYVLYWLKFSSFQSACLPTQLRVFIQRTRTISVLVELLPS